MPARLSELAERGLLRAFGETEKAMAYRHAIRLHPSHREVEDRSIRLPVSIEVPLYVLFLGEARVMWEARQPENLVWSVSLHRP